MPIRSRIVVPPSVDHPDDIERAITLTVFGRTTLISCRHTMITRVGMAIRCMFVGLLLASSGLAVAADHGHHAEIGHNVPHGTSQKDFESPAWFQTDLALWSFVVFLALLALLSKFAWKPIMDGLAKREQGIADMIASTQAAHDDAKRLLSSYERRLAEASEEVRGMLEEARRDSEATRQTIIADARKAAEEERARARHEIGLAKDDALAQIAEKAGHLAVEVAGKFLREKLGPDDQSRLVRDSVAAISSRPSVN